MLTWIKRVERTLVRLEGWLLVVCVVAMLVLAAYNVAYRNVLVPFQSHLETSGPPVVEQEKSGAEQSESSSGGEFGESADAGAGGFGGGFGGGAEAPDDEESKEESPSGFEGGFGNDDPSGGAEADDDTGAAEGFEGGFGTGGGEADSGKEGAETSDDFEGGFGGGAPQVKPKARAEPDNPGGLEPESAVDEEEAPEGGPPPEGSVASILIAVIDAGKLSWVDIFLRHMVLVVGFLGAMVATRRREHITIDAVGQYVSARWRHALGVGTNLFAVVVCIFLAKAGADLVALAVESEKVLFSGIRQWAVQLMFPIGFGLIAVHFFLRFLEDAWRAYTGEVESVDAGPREEPDAPEGGES